MTDPAMTRPSLSDERLAQTRATIDFAKSYNHKVVALMTDAALAVFDRLDKAEAGWRVRPLEWSEDPFSDAFIADTNGLGRYVIEPFERGYKVEGGNVRTLNYTIEGAKAVAQADYKARIFSALTRSPPNIDAEG